MTREIQIQILKDHIERLRSIWRDSRENTNELKNDLDAAERDLVEYVKETNRLAADIEDVQDTSHLIAGKYRISENKPYRPGEEDEW